MRRKTAPRVAGVSHRRPPAPSPFPPREKWEPAKKRLRSARFRPALGNASGLVAGAVAGSRLRAGWKTPCSALPPSCARPSGPVAANGSCVRLHRRRGRAAAAVALPPVPRADVADSDAAGAYLDAAVARRRVLRLRRRRFRRFYDDDRLALRPNGQRAEEHEQSQDQAHDLLQIVSSELPPILFRLSIQTKYIISMKICQQIPAHLTRFFSRFPR